MRKIILLTVLMLTLTVSLGFASKVLTSGTFEKVGKENLFGNSDNKNEVNTKPEHTHLNRAATFFVDNDECTEAVQLTVNTDATCTITSPGILDGATLSSGFSEEGCNWSTPAKDVWYKFTATDTSHSISYTATDEWAGISLEVYNITACTDEETPLFCASNQLVATDLVVGEEYLVRVFANWEGENSEFDLCVRTLSAPLNDNCETATVAPVNPDISCTETVEGTFQDASVSEGFGTGCGWSDPMKDVWFEFTATNNIHEVTISDAQDEWNLYIEVYDATPGCPTLGDPLMCVAGTYIILGNLEPGTLYKIRVYSTSETYSSDFVLCVGTPDPVVNDECENATTIPVNPELECVETVNGTFHGSTLSEGTGEGCGWTPPLKDVWFEFTATSESHGISFSNYDGDFAWNSAFEVYDAADCGVLGDPIFCGEEFDVALNDLIIGNTYKIRLYATSIGMNSDFTVCINTLLPPIHVSDTEYTVPELVTDVLIKNECANITNISWSTGSNFDDVNGIGYFSKNGSDFPFEEGIILSSGDINLAPGPAGGEISSGDFDLWGDDPQLTAYMNDFLNQPTQQYKNASVLEFDFTPITDSLKFNFIFASNEYGQFQCSFSDAFAFFLTNTTTGVTTNLAIVPNTNDPISVVTIRKALHSPDWGNGPECEDANPDYFAACYDPLYNGESPLISPINFYGLTVPMQALSEVEAGTVYHIKLVIQDRGDSGMDSAVFLDGGSFDIGKVELGDDLLVEGNNALCDGESVTLDTQLDPERFTFEWLKGDDIIPGANGPVLVVNESGTYTINATYIGSECAISDSVKVEIYPKMNPATPPNIEVCVIGNQIPAVDLTINEDVILSSITNPDEVTIEYYETQENAENGTNQITDTENYTATELPKTIFVRVQNTQTECVEIVSFNIVKKAVKNFNKPADIPTCVYHNVIVPVDLTQVEEGLRSQSDANLQISYYASEEDALALANPIPNVTEYLPESLPFTIYISIISDDTGCQSISTVTIVESERITPFVLDDITSCNAYVLIALPQGYYYSTEEFGKGEILPVGKKYDIGTYTVYININNQDGCVFSSKQEIEVIPCTVPKGISPNGDGLNDALDLTYYHLLEVKIFNRQGKEVYSHGPGYTNQWSGQSKSGSLLPDGTYFYKITTVTEELTGYIQLVREVK